MGHIASDIQQQLRDLAALYQTKEKALRGIKMTNRTYYGILNDPNRPVPDATVRKIERMHKEMGGSHSGDVSDAEVARFAMTAEGQRIVDEMRGIL